jgi:hypothetical protein
VSEKYASYQHQRDALVQECQRLAARLAEAERLLRGVQRGGHPVGMAQYLQDIDAFLRTTDSASVTVSEGKP